jgi:hypothetical protein
VRNLPGLSVLAPWLMAAALAAVLLPVALNEISWARAHQDVHFSGDYYVNVWRPGHDILHNRNPYPSPDDPRVAGGGGVLIYPPTLFVALLPISAPSFAVSRVVWSVVLGAMLILTLALVGVRDPRAYALWLLSAPVIAGVMWGNPTLALIFAAALLWHWRDKALAAGLVLGAAIAAKFILAPLIVWLVFTKRVRAAGIAAASAVAMTFVSWAAISFHGLHDYPRLVSNLTRFQIGEGFLVSALAARLHASTHVAELVGLVAAAAVLAVVWAVRRDERASFAIALMAVQYVTAVNHVFNLGFVVLSIALLSSRLNWLWIIVPTIWFAAHVGPLPSGSHYDLIAFSIALTLVAPLAVLLPGGGSEHARTATVA